MILQPFDLLFYKGSSILSKLIEDETGSIYSHVALALDSKHLVEINRTYNLRIDHISYRNKSFDIYRLKSDLTQEQQEIMMNYIYDTLNASYDFMEIIDILLYKVFRITIKTDPNKFICSSWINNCMASAGIVLSEKEFVTPQDLISDKLYLIK